MSEKLILRKILAVLVAFITMFSNATPVSANIIWVNPDTGEILDPPPNVQTAGSPNIRLIDPTVIVQEAGTTRVYELLLRNMGTDTATNILVSAQISANSGATVRFLDRSNAFQTLTRGSNRTITIEITVPENTPAGTYPLTLTYTFTDPNTINVMEGTDIITLRVENDEEEEEEDEEEEEEIILPRLIAGNFDVTLDHIRAGDTFQITGTISNMSEADATDVRLSASGFSSNTVRLHHSSNNIHVPTIAAGGMYNFQFYIIADERADRSSHELTFTLSYRDSQRNVHETTYKYFVNIAEAMPEEEEEEEEIDESRAMLIATDMNFPIQTLLVGDRFHVMLQITNDGDADARNIIVTAEPSSNAIVPFSASIQQQRELAQNEETQFIFEFAPTSHAETMNHTIGFTIEYETVNQDLSREERMHSFRQFVGVNVYNPEPEEEEEEEEDEVINSVPTIIISRHESNPRIVQAGQEFDLSMTFLNTHSSITVSNIDAVLLARQETQDQGSVFIPVDSSNSFFINTIPPGGEVEQHLRLYTVPDAEPRNYQLTIILNYEDDQGNRHTLERIIGINVQQTTRIETSEISVPSFANVGEPVFLSFTMFNTGRARLNNVRVRVEGDFDVSNADTFFGTMEIGNVEWYDGMIIPTMPGTQEGRVIISYESSTGEIVEIPTYFTMEVQEMIFHDVWMDDWHTDHGMDIHEEGGNNIIWVFGGMALAGGVLFFGRKKLMGRRKEQELYE